MNTRKVLGYGTRNLIRAIAVVIALAFTACEDITKSDLTGNVSLSNHSPKVGDSITAAYSPGNGTGAQTWQWFRVGTETEEFIQGATTSVYTATAADAGNKIKVQLSCADQIGSLSVTTANAVAANASDDITLTGITYTVTQTGGTDGTADTTGIVFTFSAAVSDLTSNDITITKGTGSVTTGALTGSGTSWSLAVTVTAAGNVTVSIRDGITSEAGAKNVTVYKAGETAPALTDITLNTDSVKKEYNQNETLDLFGMVVTAAYSDSSGAAVTNYTTSPANGSALTTAGTITVTVSYTEGALTKNNTFTVTVTAVDPGIPTLAYELINNRTAYRVRKGTVTGGDVVIPSVYNGLPVTEIGSASNETDTGAFSGTNITSVTIPSSVTSIDTGAFRGCDSLTSVNIAEGVMSIGYYAFSSCNSLTNITVPASVTSIGYGAFEWCPSLISIVVDEANFSYASQDGILYNKAKTRLIQTPCGISGAVIIPADVTSIGSEAFRWCNITSVTIPDSMTSIENGAFADTSLTGVTIPASVTYISAWAFYGCGNLTGIVVDEANPHYASQDGILYNKAETELIQAPCGKRGTVTIPTSVTSIGNMAFAYCNYLTGVTIPVGVTSIGYQAFYDCVSFTSITIPASVTFVGSKAFDTNHGGYTSTIIYIEGSTSGWDDQWQDGSNPANIVYLGQ